MQDGRKGGVQKSSLPERRKQEAWRNKLAWIAAAVIVVVLSLAVFFVTTYLHSPR